MVPRLQYSKRWYPVLTGTLLLAGCMSLGPQSNTAFRMSQGPSPLGATGSSVTSNRSPWNTRTPIDTQRPAIVQEPVVEPPTTLPESTTIIPEKTRIPDNPPLEAGPELTVPSTEPPRTTDAAPATEPPPRTYSSDTTPDDIPETPSLPVVPKSEPRPAPAAKLELLVNVPKRKQVGSPAAYRLLVRNTGSDTAEDVDIHCQFDPQLSFDNTTRREVRHRLGRLFPGESKELTLQLLAKSPGTHCCRFSVRSRPQGAGSSTSNETAAKTDSVEAVWKSVCVEFVSQQVQIEMLGPTLRTVGSRAEFSFKVTNRSKKQLPKLHVVLQHDAAVAPAVVSQGAARDKLSLAWDITDFKIDETAQFQVDFDCQTPANRVCLQVEVSGTGIPNDQTETCLQILPVQGALDLQISDREDPIVIRKQTGGTATPGGHYEISITNRGLQSAPRVQLDVYVSPLLKVVAAQVQVGAAPDKMKLLPLKYDLTDHRLVFDAVPQLAPDERLVYTVEVEGLTEGVADVRARLRSGLNDTAISISEPTWVANE